jgi:hypothetical protein
MGTSMQRTPNVREQHNGPLSDVANSPIATGGSPKMRDPNYDAEKQRNEYVFDSWNAFLK